MTTVIWDGTVMCADKQASENEGLQRTVTKIERLRGCLVGYAGDLSYCLKLKYWWASGAEYDKYPTPVGNEGGRLMVVGGSYVASYIRLYEGPIPIDIEDKYCAIGSGREMATGILWYLATCEGSNPQEEWPAEIAMKACIELDAGSGMGYDILPLNEREL